MEQKSNIVLVVDDDPAVRAALKFALELEGITVEVHDGAVALLGNPALRDCRCLVVDYRMPAVDGLELVEQLRARGFKAPVILITGRSTKELHSRAAKIGICRVIDKPLSDGELLEAIRSASPLMPS